MAAIMQIDQDGLPDGEPGVAREDGLKTGATVHLKSLAHESTFEFNLLWVGQHPEPDTTSVATLSLDGPSGMSFSPTPNVLGSWRIELVADRGTSSEDRQVRIFAIKRAPGALRIPAANERSDPEANMRNAGPDMVARCEFNAADGIPNSPQEFSTFVTWWRTIADLVYWFDTPSPPPLARGSETPPPNALRALAPAGGAAGPYLVPTAVQTGDYRPHAGELVLVDASKAERDLAITLPGDAPPGTPIGVKSVTMAGSVSIVLIAPGALVGGLPGQPLEQLELGSAGETITVVAGESGSWILVSHVLGR